MSSEEQGNPIPSAMVLCSVHIAAGIVACGETDEPDEEVCPCLHMYAAVGDAAATYGEEMPR